jgi:UDP-N-acetylglucosamine 2-epimerase
MSGGLLTVVGNRPQFIKMSPVSHAIAARGYRETVLHTGQHYDETLSDIFFRELDLRAPDIQLHITGRSHGAMTGELLQKIEEVLLRQSPNGVLVYGDTNSTLAAVLAAVKLRIPIAHVESGPRMGDLHVPEEVNRITADHLSTLRFAPDQPSIANLAREGITQHVYYTGDVMRDTFRLHAARALRESTLMQHPRLKDHAPFILLTLHRPDNVDSKASLEKLFDFLREETPLVLFPAHLRTRQRMQDYGLLEAFEALPNLLLTEPQGYLDTMAALQCCESVITDSGGLQKEAFFANKKALVLLRETPWPQLRDSGWQIVPGYIADTDLHKALARLEAMPTPAATPDFYGDGYAAERIVDALERHHFFGT